MSCAPSLSLQETKKMKLLVVVVALCFAQAWADEESSGDMSIDECLAATKAALMEGTSGCTIAADYKECASLVDSDSADDMLNIIKVWDERCSTKEVEEPKSTVTIASVKNEDGNVRITANNVMMKMNDEEHSMGALFATVNKMQAHIQKLEENLLASEMNQYEMKKANLELQRKLDTLQDTVDHLKNKSMESDDKLADGIDDLNTTLILSKKAHDTLAETVKVIDKNSVANEKLAKENQDSLGTQSEILKNLTRDWTAFDTDKKKGVLRMPGRYAHYTNDITIDDGGKHPHTFFPLTFAIPSDSQMYELCIRRVYSWKPDTDQWYTSSKNHHAGVSVCLNFMSRQWGGIPPYIDIKHHVWSYTPTIKSASLSSPVGNVLIIMIRGGGGNFIVEGNLPSIMSPKVYTKRTKIYECCNGRHQTWVQPQNGVTAMTSPCNGVYGSGYGQGFNAYRPSCGA